MPTIPAQAPRARRRTLLPLAALALALCAAAPASAVAQGARRCPTCAPAPDRGSSPTPRGGAGGIARRGAPGAPAVPMTDVALAIGGARYTGRVDAHCAVDERATPDNGRAYLRAMYPWFGQRVAADRPQWRFTLEVRRGARPDSYGGFVFSFLDGTRKSGTIQTVAGAERMGSGTVRVTRHGAGARFEVAGRSKEGETIRATIDCAEFQGSEGAGG